MELAELHADLSAFADEEDEVAVDSDGSFILTRNGQELAGQLIEKPDGQLFVRLQESVVSYRTFLTHELAGLHTFADRLVTRRPPVEAFIDSQVEVSRATDPAFVATAMQVLRDECENAPAFSARVSFVTADAGHGKTALLRQYQHEQAQSFLAGTGNYLFWHVDLQGRQLLRLSEALMGDLGELRIAGLWMPSIIRLMRRRALVLAIDGFDELAAEQGSTDALGALASLVAQLGGHGSVVAAARRTFFDTDDYLRRAGVLGRAIQSPCEFNQLRLLPWTRNEGVEFLTRAATGSKRQYDAVRTYDEILDALGNDTNHPMVTRPFLLAQVVRALAKYDIAPREFIKTADDSLSGVAAVVQAFVRREVSEKWKSRETGQPYLTEQQHMEFLADVAEEMYRSQKDRLDLDVVETIATLLLDHWDVDANRKPQILEMVRMHVLLVPPNDGASGTRSFDHPEFRDYFIAYALRAHIERVMDGASAASLAQYLSVAQLSDSTARYVCGMLNRSEDRVRKLLKALELTLASEWRPTFLQINIGTLVPFLLADVPFASELSFSGKVVYSSLVFERSRITNVRLRGGSFVNASLVGACWDRVVLEECDLGELLIDESCSFTEVRFQNCKIDGVRARSAEDEIREYAPQRIWWRLNQSGISASIDGTLVEELAERPESDALRVLRRLLRLFNRTTVVSDEQLSYRFKQDHYLLFDVLIPILEENGIFAERTWKGAGQARVWGLTERLDDLLAAEGGTGRPNLVRFWSEVAKA